MKFSFTIILLTALVPFTFGSNDTLVAYNRSNSENILAYAHIGEEDTNQLFDELADKDATPIFLDNNYSREQSLSSVGRNGARLWPHKNLFLR